MVGGGGGSRELHLKQMQADFNQAHLAVDENTRDPALLVEVN